MLDFFGKMSYHLPMMENRTQQKVFSYMERHHMIQPGDHLILGVSGGADSVCLLFLLLEYRKKMPAGLTVVHVNHGIRGEAADEDAAFVRRLCEENDVPFRLVSVDVPAFAAREKCSYIHPPH